MANKVGHKGQFVIDKEIREQLGLEPGWLALQRLVDDHLEVYFLPPEHRRSLKASLAGQIKTRIASDEEWDKAREIAWERAARQKASTEERGP